MKRIYLFLIPSLVMLLMLYVNIPEEGYFIDDYERVVSYRNDLYRFEKNDTLTIAVEKDAPGVFLYNGSYYGFLHAIFREYALSIGKVLKIVSCDSQRDLIHMLNSNSVAFGVSISSLAGISNESNRYFIPDLGDSSRYVVLGNPINKTKNKLPLSELLDSSKVIYKRGAKEIEFLAEKSHDYLCDTASARFMTTNDYVALIRKEEYDFLICKEEEAFFYCYNYKNIIKTHQLDQWVYSMVMTNKRNRILFREFNKWFEEFRTSEIYDEIVNYYHNDNYFKNFIEEGFLNPIRSISHFDDLFRNKTKNTLLNWKLLAAMCYVESKFNPL
ncbi:MAG: transporter substrate-binding domain-containing protein, partial [Rikenellaceae bacterium]